jgi:hypothetical protein
MNDLGMRVVACCSSLDSECYVRDQDYYCDNPDQQEKYEQGKYNMGYSLLSYSLFN